MKSNIITMLTSKDNKCACSCAEKIISESHETDVSYDCFEEFSSLLNHPKSLVRNRALNIIAANAQYIPRILEALHDADLSGYKDSMRPLIEKDILETIEGLNSDCGGAMQPLFDKLTALPGGMQP